MPHSKTFDLSAHLDRRALLGLGAGALTGMLQARTARAEAGMTLEEVTRRIHEQQQKLESLYVDCELEGIPLVDPKILFEWFMMFAVAKLQYVDAIKGPKVYQHVIMQVDTPRISDPTFVNERAPLAIQADQKRLKNRYEDDLKLAMQQGFRMPPNVARHFSKRSAFNGAYTWQFMEDTGVYAIPRYEPGLIQASTYRSRVGLPYSGPDKSVVTHSASESWRHEWLPEAFEKGRYRVLPDIEKVEGAACVVVEGAYKADIWREAKTISDRLWLDPALGFSLLKREWSEGSHVLSRDVNSRFKEVNPGVWLPQQSDREGMAPLWDPRDYLDKPVVRWRVTVNEFRVNNVPDDLFEIEPGAKVEDQRQQATPG